MQRNRVTHGKSTLLAYDLMQWLFGLVGGKIQIQEADDLLGNGSIEEREKNLLMREAKRLNLLGLQRDEIFEQLIMINRTFFIQPLSDNEILSICEIFT